MPHIQNKSHAILKAHALNGYRHPIGENPPAGEARQRRERPGALDLALEAALAWITGASNHDIFNIVLGSKPLGFEFGDMNVTGSPSIQFKDGVFNGFSLVEDFAVNGKTYEFSMQGSTWTINWLKNNSSSDVVASGYVTTGAAGLINQASLFPSLPELSVTAVPEPAIFALFGIG